MYFLIEEDLARAAIGPFASAQLALNHHNYTHAKELCSAALIAIVRQCEEFQQMIDDCDVHNTPEDDLKALAALG